MATKTIKTVQLAKEWKDKNCPVCMDHFTAVIRQPIQCAYCPHATCRQCCSRYLLTTMNDPHCMDCKREWNREFIDKNLTQTFRKGPLKQHRRKVLMDRERGRLPAMQIYVEARIEQSKISAERAIAYGEWVRVKKERKRIQAEHNPDTETLEQLQSKVKPHDLKLLELDTQIKALDARQRKVHMILYGKEKPEARQFIMKCPADTCRGFLSQAWKCGTCQKHFCSDCHAEKTGHKDEEHTCNADAKATASMIRNETHPCPKCGIRISKIDGCFGKDTPILTWDGSVKMAQDIRVGDTLIGDDGEPRIVTDLVHGEDILYKVTQKKGMTYVVNSKHKLALKLSGDRKLSWMESIGAWSLKWLDTENQKRKMNKFYRSESKTKEEAYNEALSIKDSLPENDVMEVTVDDYVKFLPSMKKELMGFKSTSTVSWQKQEVVLDPYIMGLYIGDGINDGLSFAVNAEKDPEILESISMWARQHDCSVKKDDTYRYRVARNNLSAQHNPLKKVLDAYNLTRSSKSIPKSYLVNDKETRIQLLAGIIDTDGYVSDNGKRVVISQSNHALGNQIAYLGRSLGFNVWVDFVKKENICWPTETKPKCYQDHIRICMSGEALSDIPTRLPRKKCVNSTPNKDWSRSGLDIQEMGKGEYFGWSVTGKNKRFLLNDFTVVRNCDQMWCVECHTTFSWNSGQILQNTVVHNPHYYEYLRRQNGGVVPREAGDVPCGGLPQNWLFTRAILETPNIGVDERTKVLDIHRGLSDIQYARLPNYPLRQQANVNQEHDIQYLMNNLTEEAWGTALERTETNFERRKEIGLILQTLLHVGSEKLTGLYNATTNQRSKLVKPFLKEMEDVRTYSNDSLIKKGIEMGIVVPQIEEDWRWMTMSRVGMKRRGAKEVEDETPAAPTAEPPRNEVVLGSATVATPTAEDDTTQASDEEIIEVDLGGEVVEMTLDQARAMMGTR